MKRFTAASCLGLAALLAAGLAFGQTQFPTDNPSINAPGMVNMCLGPDAKARPCNDFTAPAVRVIGGVNATPYPTGAAPITANAAGTTGAVVGTLAAAAGRITYICNVDVSAIGGTAAVGPIVIAGLTGGSFTYQGSSSAAGGQVLSRTYAPCIPASAMNTAITITTTADGTATAVNVNASGFQL